jgi:hypothetical protein
MVPTPMPHPYIGKLNANLSQDVEIGGKKAAVKGSKAKFESPGHFPMPPGVNFQSPPNNEAEVTNGCCDTVKINKKDACVLGAKATSCDDMHTPDGCNIVAMGATVVLPIRMPCIDDLTYQQDGGFMINTRQLQAAPRQPGPAKKQQLSNPQWSSSTAKVGEEVTLKVSSTDLHANAAVHFTIWKEGFDPAVDIPVAKVQAPNKGNAAEAKWKIPMPENLDTKYVFTAIAFKCAEVEAGSMEMAQPEFSNLKWMIDGNEVTEAHVGDKAKLTADVTNLPDGQEVVVDIYESDTTSEDDYIESLPAVIKNSKVELGWEVIYTDDSDDTSSDDEQGYTLPEYIFNIRIEETDIASAESPELKVSVKLAYQLKDEDGNILSDKPYLLVLADGSKIQGRTDANGYILEEKIPIGKTEIII